MLTKDLPLLLITIQSYTVHCTEEGQGLKHAVWRAVERQEKLMTTFRRFSYMHVHMHAYSIQYSTVFVL